MRLPSRRLTSSSDQTVSMNGSTFGRDVGEVLVDRLAVELLKPVAAPQRIVMRQQAVDLLRQRTEVGEIHQADGAAPDLVFVGGADAALGGADLDARVGILAQRIEFLMQRKDQRHVFGDTQVLRRDRDALTGEPADFFQQRARIEHHAVADHR